MGRHTASWRETTTLIKTLATLRPNSASRKSPKPTTCCRIRPSARRMTRPAGCLERRFPLPTGGGTQSSGPSVDDLFGNAGGSLGDIFGGLFNGGPTTQTTRYSTARGPRRGSDVEGEVTVDFVQAIEGVTVGMQMVSDTACEACRGTGARQGRFRTSARPVRARHADLDLRRRIRRHRAVSGVSRSRHGRR